MMEPVEARWLLLIHQLPPQPDYLRVKVRRRLQRLGAVLFKSSVYVLPARDETLEDFQWLVNEIIADGGEATICAAALLSGVLDEDLEESFRSARATDYRDLAAEARTAVHADAPDRLARLRRKLEAIGRIDWFSTPEKAEAERALSELERHIRWPAAQQSGSTAIDSDAVAATGAERPRGARWVTRAGVFVDRIASAWLIRRFIDPDARFLFVAPERYRPQPGDLRFDMYGGEFTHVGDRCTFETLLARFDLDDPALLAIAEVVHDIDCKDEKFGREEAAGIAAVLEGIALSTTDDEERVTRGSLLFEGLHGQLQRTTRR